MLNKFYINSEDLIIILSSQVPGSYGLFFGEQRFFDHSDKFHDENISGLTDP